jgi:hypothetical protein
MTKNIPSTDHTKQLVNTTNFNELIDQYYYTFVHQLSGFTDEKSLSITNNARVFKDTSTDIFVKNILGNESIKFLFLDYTFHYINSMIKTKINDYLLDNHQLPLYADENVYFVFKGGNVMNYFMELYIKKIENIFKDISLENVTSKYQNENISALTDNDNIETSTYASFFIRLKENFKISDIDYSIYIAASNYARYILIHGGIVRILGQTLSEISNKFDILFENQKPNILTANVPNTDDDVNDVNIYENEYYQLKHLIVNDKFRTYMDIFKNSPDNMLKSPLTNNSLDSAYLKNMLDSILAASEFIKNIESSIDSIDNFTKIYELTTFIQYIQTIKYFNITNNKININLSNLTNIQQKLDSYLNSLVDKKIDNISKSDFYSNDNIIKIKSGLAEKMSELVGKIKFEENNNGLTTKTKKYELISTPKTSDIVFEKRGNLIIKSNNNPIDQYIIRESNDKHLHYITFNSIVKSVKKANTTNFNLMRIKINIMLTGNKMKINDSFNNMSIPSEFVDVSIPFYDDSAGNRFLDSAKKGLTKIFLKNNIINRDVVIQSYGLDDLTHDLSDVLFEQNFFIPWLDLKYNKRVLRMLFISILNAYVSDCTIECKNQSIKKYRDILDFSSIILSYMVDVANGKMSAYPYAECGKFIETSNYSTEHIRSEIDDIMIKYKNLLFVQLMNIRHEYHEMANLINFLIVYSRYVTFDKELAFDFMNKNRSDYLYVSLNKNTFEEYTKESNDKFTDMLKIIVNDGYKILFIFENLVNLRQLYNQSGHSDQTIYFNSLTGPYHKYIKYKAKYLALRNSKIIQT